MSNVDDHTIFVIKYFTPLAFPRLLTLLTDIINKNLLLNVLFVFVRNVYAPLYIILNM